MIMDSAALYQVFLQIFLGTTVSILVCCQYRSVRNFCKKFFFAIESDPKSTFTVNLAQQKITIDSTTATEAFDINPYKKDNMINGFDDIDYL